VEEKENQHKKDRICREQVSERLSLSGPEQIEKDM